MEAATDPPWDRFLYFPLPLPEFDLEYTTDLDLQWRGIFRDIFNHSFPTCFDCFGSSLVNMIEDS